MREKGIIKRYIEDRGFGFIQRENGPDVFFHFRDVGPDGQEIRERAAVEFELTQGFKGARAVNVVLL
jgi:CspA family cold shock protein